MANLYAMKDAPTVPPDTPQVQELARLQSQMQRPAFRQNIEGSFELGWGTALMFFGLGPYVTAILPKSFWMSAWSSWIGFLPLGCAAFAPYAIPRILKRFVTWPRIGYVANPHDLKLVQLIRIMVFGGALGFSLSLPFVIISQINLARSRPPGWPVDLHAVIWPVIKLCLCIGLVVYSGPKVIRKHQPLPSAYDGALIKQELKKTAVGRKRLRIVNFTLLTIFLVTPLLLCALVLGVMYLTNHPHSQPSIASPGAGYMPSFVKRDHPLQLSEMMILSFMVGLNTVLYLMGNGFAIKQHRWKWLVVGLLLIGPLLVAPLVPYPVVHSSTIAVFEAMPPVILCIGALWVLSGVGTLISFIRHNPMPPPEPA